MSTTIGQALGRKVVNQLETMVPEAQGKRPANPCSKTRPASDPYEVWEDRTSGWEWAVLKKYQRPELEAVNPMARWFVFVKSPFCPEGEYGDEYVHRITRYGKLREARRVSR